MMSSSSALNQSHHQFDARDNEFSLRTSYLLYKTCPLKIINIHVMLAVFLSDHVTSTNDRSIFQPMKA